MLRAVQRACAVHCRSPRMRRACAMRCNWPADYSASDPLGNLVVLRVVAHFISTRCKTGNKQNRTRLISTQETTLQTTIDKTMLVILLNMSFDDG
eukprot:540512-Pleurochrysis_carterae.AAC.1